MHTSERSTTHFTGRKAEGRKAKAILPFGILIEKCIWIHTGLFSLFFSPTSTIAQQRDSLHHLIVLCTERRKTEGCGTPL